MREPVDGGSAVAIVLLVASRITSSFSAFSRFACERWPRVPITLRHGTRVGAHHISALYEYDLPWVRDGGLMSYGPDLQEFQSGGAGRKTRQLRRRGQHRKRYGIIFEPMPIIGKHYVHPGLSKTVAGEPQREDATVFLINTYRTPVSGVFRRKDSGFAVCAKTWLAFRSLWQESGIQVAVRFAKTRAS
jgi:hypothetical protein